MRIAYFMVGPYGGNHNANRDRTPLALAMGLIDKHWRKALDGPALSEY